MKPSNDFLNSTLSDMVMEMYGISKDQYFSFNRDYQIQLLHNYIDVLSKNNAAQKNEKVKTKVLGIFKKK